LISNSNFKIQFEFEKLFNMKLVELEILKILYMILGVIWQNCLHLKFLGECYSTPANHGRAACGMGAGEPPWNSTGFQTRLQLPPHPCACLLAPLETSLKG
jgi:hypothetical protein